jgi:hypothetical protein
MIRLFRAHPRATLAAVVLNEVRGLVLAKIALIPLLAALGGVHR